MKTQKQIEDNLELMQTHLQHLLNDKYMEGYKSALEWVLKD